MCRKACSVILWNFSSSNIYNILQYLFLFTYSVRIRLTVCKVLFRRVFTRSKRAYLKHTHTQLSSCSTGRTNRPMYFDFSRLYPFFPQPHGSVFGSYTCHLSTLSLTLYRGAGLPIHIIGKVLWDPKRRRAWSSWCSILSGKGSIGSVEG